MPFSDPFSSIVITPLANGSYERLNRQPSEAESGWDSMRDTYLMRYDAGGDDVSSILANFPFINRAMQVSGKNMWVVSRSPRLLALGLAQVEVVSMGLLTARGFKVTYDAAAASQSGANVVTPDGTFAKVQTREGSVTASFQYISFGITPGSAGFMTALNGRAKNPPAGWAPYVSPTVWDTLTTYTYNYPNGWIYEGAAMENLPGLSNVFLVTEKYAYQYPKTPS
jgi:hypothetical protein